MVLANHTPILIPYSLSLFRVNRAPIRSQNPIFKEQNPPSAFQLPTTGSKVWDQPTSRLTFNLVVMKLYHTCRADVKSFFLDGESRFCSALSPRSRVCLRTAVALTRRSRRVSRTPLRPRADTFAFSRALQRQRHHTQIWTPAHMGDFNRYELCQGCLRR